MNNYAIVFKETLNIIQVEAEFFELADGFLKLYKMADHGCHEAFAVYALDTVSSCVYQQKFTTKEIIEQMEGG